MSKGGKKVSSHVSEEKHRKERGENRNQLRRKRGGIIKEAEPRKKKKLFKNMTIKKDEKATSSGKRGLNNPKRYKDERGEEEMFEKVLA